MKQVFSHTGQETAQNCDPRGKGNRGSDQYEHLDCELGVRSWILVQEEHDGTLSERERSECGETEVVGICEAELWKGESYLVKEIQKYG